MDALFCGIDAGTQGARCLLVTEKGEVLGEGHSSYRRPRVEGLPEEWFEQNPADWMEAIARAGGAALEGGARAADVRAIGVTSTSGTLCALETDGGVVRPAIMYSDGRSRNEARRVQQAGASLAKSLGYRFKPSFGLPKILWMKRHEPDLFERADLFVSPTDFVIGLLTGEWGRTDQTNALKFGYDLLGGSWPDFIEADLGIPVGKLPRVQMSGEEAGRLGQEWAERLGLPAGTFVAAGLTDGCASLFSSGATAPGQFNTTIGTTLVVKGVSRELLLDPAGRIYCHRHPEGWWLPGGASNTGAECIAEQFDPDTRDRLTEEVLRHSPTDLVSYPLVGRGERFPFNAPDAGPFLLGDPAGPAERFCAYLEGVACLERMAYQVLEELGAAVEEPIFSAGGGAENDGWLQIRADTMGRAVVRPRITGAAMGAVRLAGELTRQA